MAKDKKMTYARIEAMSSCLPLLVGKNEPLKDKDGNFIREKLKGKDDVPIDGNLVTEYRAYKTKGEARPRTAVNIALLIPYMQTLQAERDAINKQLLKGLKPDAKGDLPLTIELQGELSRARNMLMRRIITVKGLKLIDYADLDAETNGIPADVLAGCMPVLVNFLNKDSEPTGEEWTDDEAAPELNDEPPAADRTGNNAVSSNGVEREPAGV